MVLSSARRAVGAALVVPLLSLVPVGSPAHASPAADSASAGQRSNGEVKTKKRCNPSKYETNYKILSGRREPKITQIKAYYMAPSASRKVTKKAKFYLRLRSQVKLNSSTSVAASGVAKVLAKAETSIGMQLKASGELTAAGSVKVTDTISNPTRSNQKFVFFKGYESASGGFRQFFCKIYYEPGQSYGPAFVTYRDGDWQSYNLEGEGALRCSGGQVDEGLGRLALAIGC